jgi:hypothetical protein
MSNFDLSIIQPWHVLTAVTTFSLAIWRMIVRLRKNVLDELKVVRVSVRELLQDLAVRNPEAMGRIVAAMDDQSVIEFVRSTDRRKERKPFPRERQ